MSRKSWSAGSFPRLNIIIKSVQSVRLNAPGKPFLPLNQRTDPGCVHPELDIEKVRGRYDGNFEVITAPSIFLPCAGLCPDEQDRNARVVKDLDRYAAQHHLL